MPCNSANSANSASLHRSVWLFDSDSSILLYLISIKSNLQIIIIHFFLIIFYISNYLDENIIKKKSIGQSKSCCAMVCTMCIKFKRDILSILYHISEKNLFGCFPFQQSIYIFEKKTIKVCNAMFILIAASVKV